MKPEDKTKDNPESGKVDTKPPTKDKKEPDLRTDLKLAQDNIDLLIELNTQLTERVAALETAAGKDAPKQHQFQEDGKVRVFNPLYENDASVKTQTFIGEVVYKNGIAEIPKDKAILFCDAFPKLEILTGKGEL